MKPAEMQGHQSIVPDTAGAPRPPARAMRLERLGSLHTTRISFIRSVVRRMMRDRWRIECRVFDIDGDGYGTAIYRVATTDNLYNFVLFSRYLDDSQRTDRVIANAWDCAFALVEGDVDEPRLEQLRDNVPQQEAGRCDPGVIVLSRANRSVRNFEAIVAALAAGRQPDPEQIARVGYLYRTTAVYGNGKFGLADYPKIHDWQDFGLPFAAQMFTVYLLRHFSIRQVEHIARHRSPATAVPMDPRLQRYLGIGNSTGLGMAPFLINHPKLIAQWVLMRETALARCLAQPATDPLRARLMKLIERAARHAGQTWVDDPLQQRNNETLVNELEHARLWLAAQQANGRLLWKELTDHARAHWSLETQEMLHSLIMELYPERVDPLEQRMGTDEDNDLEPEMPLGTLAGLIETRYDWALRVDFSRDETQHYFWYRSAEKEEPRLGVRREEPGADREMPLDIARQVRRCHDRLQAYRRDHGDDASVIDLLLVEPGERGIIRRIQSMSKTVMGEIRANLLDHDLLPMHLLRCKLAFFGATKFDPRSSRWVRITLFQGAPLIEDIGEPFEDDWVMPLMPSLEPGQDA